MPSKTGRSQAIRAWVAAHPGVTYAEIGKQFGFDAQNGLMSYMLKVGQLFGVGPHHRKRYFATAAEADAARDEVARAIERDRIASAERQARLSRAGTIRRRAKRHQSGIVRHVRGRTAGLCEVRLDKGVTLCPDVRVTIAPPSPRGRFEPELLHEGELMQAWRRRRAVTPENSEA